MTDPADRLVVTVDVECDSDGGPTWRNSAPLAFRNVPEGMAGVLLPILERTGSVATLLVSNVVLDHAPSVEALGSLPRVELGTHLHGDFLSPSPRCPDPTGLRPEDNQCDYTDDVERAKLEAITQLFESSFGSRPTSFRAGRWSAGGRTARLLAELGYLVDSSVTPGMWWRDGGRSVDFRDAPAQPYRPASDDIACPGDLPIWELPVSIVPRWWLPQKPAWLRPSLTGFREMRGVVRSIARRHPAPRTFVAMLHSSELSVGTSPYSRDGTGAARVARRLEKLLRWAADEGIESTTLTRAAKACAAR
ncbi:MAG TPA: hypothetical protein VNA57_11985 [Acidimicrobiales bacterium]|nr:hypothetical protein [Acidimicrobiales bacterium]